MTRTSVRVSVCRFFSSRFRVGATGLIVFLLAFMVWSPWRGQAQAPIKAPAFRQGGGRLAIAPHKVPFKPGPFGPDGKIHPLPSQKTVFHPEMQFEQAKASKALAEAGMAELTTKPSVKVLRADALQAHKWRPAKL